MRHAIVELPIRAVFDNGRDGALHLSVHSGSAVCVIRHQLIVLVSSL